MEYLWVLILTQLVSAHSEQPEYIVTEFEMADEDACIQARDDATILIEREIARINAEDNRDVRDEGYQYTLICEAK